MIINQQVHNRIKQVAPAYYVMLWLLLVTVQVSAIQAATAGQSGII
jgi:hypothetical protein